MNQYDALWTMDERSLECKILTVVEYPAAGVTRVYMMMYRYLFLSVIMPKY